MGVPCNKGLLVGILWACCIMCVYVVGLNQMSVRKGNEEMYKFKWEDRKRQEKDRELT